MNPIKHLTAAAVSMSVLASAAFATEGGIETYLLGSRDSFAGILPPAGSYWNNDFVFFSGSAPAFSSGGAVVTDAEIDVFTYKFNFTHVFTQTLGSARLGLNINLPYVSADGTYSEVLGRGLSGKINDAGENAFGDIVVSPLLNWKSGKLNTMLALQFFLPTGDYNTASANPADRTISALNAGKNRFAFDPTVAMTWFDPTSGWEYTGALGVTISAKNDATNYQTAPELHFEGTIMRHLPNKIALGVTGYAYQQLGDDSGSGADAIKQLTGASSLEARVFGLGPVISWSSSVGEVPISLKAKYISEFGAKRRFESDKLWLTLGLVF